MVALSRRLGPLDAVVIGLGSMLGAGVFVVWGPAAAAAGTAPALLGALALAALVAACNATGSARLAARYPESGGTYVYGREQLGAYTGFLAGWAFVVGKTASCAAMALTIGFYLWPEHARPVAAAAVVLLAAVNVRGVAKTALATRILVVITLAVLVAAVVAGLTHGGTAAAGPAGTADPLAAAGLLFFAFAGYARIATLGEEVRDPARTIPRAVRIALAVVLVIYAAVALTCLTVLGMPDLATSTAPLADVVARSAPVLVPVVRAGAAIAVCGVLLSLLAGVGRTVLAMGRRADLPRRLAAVHPRYETPWLAELAVAAIVVAVVSLADVRGAIGFSSVAVLTYYAITNAAAWTLGGPKTLRAVAALGLIGCIVLATTLPEPTVLAGVGMLVLGTLAYAVNRR
ncbi:APC family permease [Catellatospora sp. KI3]|uniref:APC family permease n=1 Tax=Catellatospora sp. KI3 TaxID=3041620 RepID=UPI002482EEC9|nr:APC family permease [Catellatospora sp. KI3]MDI1465831.1 APC family permease [Catellatospora sp. KI3]